MSQWLHTLAHPGPRPALQRAARMVARAWLRLRALGTPEYRPPDEAEWTRIECDLAAQGIAIEALRVSAPDFTAFQETFPFPSDYYDGTGGAIHVEKQLEHYIAWLLIGPERPQMQPYLDVAACASPWAMLLRERGVESYAIDLAPDGPYASLPYYERQDATKTRFADHQVGSASLQCALEMFAGDSDTALVNELARVLRPGGRAVISPLYLHTHPCHYQTPDNLHRVKGDAGATTYVRNDCWGVASSRKYSANTFMERIWRPALASGLVPSLWALRNAHDIHPQAYLRIILVLEQPAPQAVTS